MKARIVVAVLVVVALFAALWSVRGAPSQTPSVDGRGAQGYRAAWRYLEERGFPVEAWREEIRDLPPAEGVLVVAAPFGAPFESSDSAVLSTWVHGGGALVLLPSGRASGEGEARLLLAFHHAPVAALPRLPWRDGWRSWLHAERELTCALDEPGWPATLRVHAGTWRLDASSTAKVFYRDAQGNPAVFEEAFGRGRVLFIDNGSVWGNAWLSDAGNLAFLEQVFRGFEGPIWFDEWHHRLVSVTGSDRPPSLAFNLLLVHLALLYVLVAWSISRRFGRPRTAPDGRVSVTERDLLALADLHRRCGHQADAARRLLELARHAVPDPTRLPDGTALLDLAQQVGRLQAPESRNVPSEENPHA